jgi:Zn-dependent M16 (insulinase) family peptidase
MLLLKVKEHFIDNHHKLILTMTPDPKFVDEREEVLKGVEKRLVENLSPEEKSKVLQMDQALKLEQAAKEDEKLLDCLPSLQIEDIPLKKPRHVVSFLVF